MREITKATIGFSWAVSMLGLQQAAKIVWGSDSRKADSEESGSQEPDPITSMTVAAEDRLQDLFKSAFEAGDHFQREMIDGLTHYLTLEVYNPARLANLSTDLFRDSMETFRFFLPMPRTLVAWQEIFNKFSVYQLVKRVQAKLTIPRDRAFDLKEYADKAYALGPFESLWAVEGLGHDYADSVRESGGELKELLVGDVITPLPSGSLLMFHAGIGLSFAEKLLQPMDSRTSQAELRQALERFVTLCRENSAPGYTGAALESLGLVVRTFHSRLVPTVDRLLHELDPEVLGYFWHGVGRALYFHLVNFLPYRDPMWRAYEMGRQEAPHDLGRLNAWAGTTWAITLVNMRHPEVMSWLLAEHGEKLSQDEAFANGVGSSLTMRYDTSPDDPNIASFRAHRPDGSNGDLGGLWDRLVRHPANQAVDRYHPVLKKAARLEEVFRFQSLEELVKGLEAASGSPAGAAPPDAAGAEADLS